MKILVVDDSEPNRKLLKVVLEAESFEVVTATDGIEALEVMDRSMVDAIISDVLMPRMDGYRLCYEVRKSAKFKAVPFIIYTATYTSPKDEKVALNFGADKFLRKPASSTDIISTLHEVMKEAVDRRDNELREPKELLAMREYSEALVKKLEESNLELEKSNKVKSEFLSVMSHELRTPLNIIMGYAELIKDEMVGDADQGHRSSLVKIETQANALMAMVSSIVQATEIESGAITIRKHKVDVCQLMQELRTQYDAPLDKNLVLVWKYPQSLPSLVTDDVVLTQILQKLIDNAIKFTKRGNVTVSARVNGHYEFEVSDTGIGIPEGSLPVVFDMFKQVDSSSTREFGGVGLGLYIVKKYSELLGGKIDVESTQGSGSTFTVRIPCNA